MEEFFKIKLTTKIKRDFFIALGLFIISIIATFYFDIFDNLYEITRKYEHSEIDELFPIIFFFSIIITWFSYKRVRENIELIDELKNINEKLEERVKEEVDKQRQKDKILIKQSKMIAMAELISNISHHWRQPLSVISLTIQSVIMNYNLGRLNKKDIDNLETKALIQIQKLSSLIDNFRTFFASSNIKSEFNIKDTIEFSLLMLTNELKDKNININIINGNFTIESYKNEFTQIIVAILKNAYEAIIIKEKEKSFIGQIDIKATKEKNSLLLIIKDNGIGIEKKIIDKIYEPYFTTKFEMKGVGIGLFMVKEMIERELKGSIDVNSENGTEFIIKLPLKEVI